MRESLHQLVRSHRNIYRFGGKWAYALLSAVPWISVLLLGLLFFFAHKNLVLSPGVLFDLPEAPLHDTARTGLTALMLPVQKDSPGVEETLVFFDDDRFSLLDDEQKESLLERLRQRIAAEQKGDFLVMADKRVPHSDVMFFVNLARKAGIARVNVAIKPE